MSPQCNSAVSRPAEHEVLLRNDHWQLLSEGDGLEILLYSAFYDNRPKVGRLPVVRILAVIAGRNDSLYCQLWYNTDEVTPVHVTPANISKNGRGDEVNHIFYGQYYLTCPLDRISPPPTHVSIVRRPCAKSTTFLPVTVPRIDDDDASATNGGGTMDDGMRQFGVCVAIAFGQLKPDELIEWFELNRMFGVAEFNIYNSTLTSHADKVLRYYVNKGVLNLRQMPPPAANNFSVASIKLASPSSLNDCLLRNMYRYKYVIALDFDEIIVPKFHATYSGLVRTLNKRYSPNSSFYSYTFRSAFFLLDFNETQADSPLLTVRRRTRTPSRGFLYSAKSFVDPLSCESIFNHYCFVSFYPDPSHPGGSRTIDVHPSIALIHHYRQCNPVKMDCIKMMAEPQKDDTMLRHQEELLKRIQRVHSEMAPS